jgi:hypothetical protein
MNATGRTASGFLEIAEMQREAELLLVRQLLVAEYQNRVFGHAGMDGRDLGRPQRLPTVDTGHFAGEGRSQLPNRYTQAALPLAARAGKTGGVDDGTISTDTGATTECGPASLLAGALALDNRGRQEMNRLDGKVALISGAARGIGAETARLMVEAGAKVLIGDVLDERGRETAQTLGDAALYVHLDVTSEEDWTAAAAAALDRFGMEWVSS